MPLTILVADDSASMRSILEMTFAGEDARVVTVGSGDQAVAKAREIRPDIVLDRQSFAGIVQVDGQAHLKSHPVFLVAGPLQQNHQINTGLELLVLPYASSLELVGGRLLPDGPGKSAQLMYQNAAGTRVTVYLRKPEAGADAAFRYERHGELGLFYWVESGAGYALVGALPREDLLALAEAIYRQKPEMPGAASAPAS